MDLWDNLEKAIGVISKGNDAYIDIKNGNKSTDASQLAEQSAQGSISTNILSVNSLFIIGSIASIIALAYVFKGK
ncbi:MAG: hypothetical protein LBT96_05430 [Campylobacteraceae bacterium]|jgi:hypothetical protein|nr:hypothetical protein [Campylobacteraceae bacterium]